MLVTGLGEAILTYLASAMADNRVETRVGWLSDPARNLSSFERVSFGEIDRGQKANMVIRALRFLIS
jgi:hypothetical protein